MKASKVNQPAKGLVFSLVFFIGIGAGVAINHFIFSAVDEMSADVNEPLYWVAPMDPNYRRDKPGKSPMGMDLIPVFQESASSSDAEKGVVTISPQVMQNMGVRTASVVKGFLAPTVSAVGRITYDENRLVHVHPRIAGWVEKLYIKAMGEQVQQGAPLYELYSPELVNAQEEYLLALAAKDDELVQAAKSRLQALHIPDSHIARLNNTGKVSQFVLFTAPQSGVIEHLNIREGYYVTPDKTLLSIGNLSSVWMIADVLEQQANWLSVGTKAKMSLASLPGRLWDGEIDFIYPTFDAEYQTMRVRLTFDNSKQQLKPNMLANVSFTPKQHMQQLLIPKQAVIDTGEQQRVVIALGEGRFKSIDVKTGASDSNSIAITHGLTEGEHVVVSSHFLIDSQSAIDSDFLRMKKVETESRDTLPRARVKGQVNSMDMQTRVLNISREAIEKWDRPPTTMDFIADDSLDLALVNIDDVIDFTFEIRDGEFVIINVHQHHESSAHDAGHHMQHAPTEQ